MEILEKIKTSIAEFDEKRKALLGELKNDFGPMLKPLFDKYPDVEDISWTQYTPYFNDGDECVFGVRNDDISINGEDEWDMDETDREKFKDAKKEFEDLLTSIPDDFFKDLFGDHMEVKILKDCTVETEGYEHD